MVVYLTIYLEHCVKVKVKVFYTWWVDGWFGEPIISAGQGELALENILESQAEKNWT